MASQSIHRPIGVNAMANATEVNRRFYVLSQIWRKKDFHRLYILAEYRTSENGWIDDFYD